MKRKILYTIFATVILMKGMAEPPVEDGKLIFTSRCATCHNVNKTVVGPALAGIDQRRSMDWIVKFVQSSQSLIRSGDNDAVAVFAEFNNIPMPDHPDLSAENIKDIVSYIKSQAATTTTSDAPFARPGKMRPAYVPVAADNYLFFGGLFAGIMLIIFSLVLFVRVKEIERGQGEEISE